MHRAYSRATLTFIYSEPWNLPSGFRGVQLSLTPMLWNDDSFRAIFLRSMQHRVCPRLQELGSCYVVFVLLIILCARAPSSRSFSIYMFSSMRKRVACLERSSPYVSRLPLRRFVAAFLPNVSHVPKRCREGILLSVHLLVFNKLKIRWLWYN